MMRYAFSDRYYRPQPAPRIIVAAIVLPLLGCNAKEPALDRPSEGDPRIVSILNEVADRHGIVGMGAGIVRATGEPDLGVVGWSKSGSTIPIGMNALWHIGSCTKPMTATVAARFVEDGRLKWTTTLAEAFPELERQLGPIMGGMTVEHLLSHRSGLPRDPENQARDRLRTGREQRLAKLQQIAELTPQSTPGVRYEYSNFGYAVIGAIIERVSGRAFRDVMRDELFVPMGLGNVVFEGDHAPGQHGVIGSHHPDGRVVRPGLGTDADPTWLRPAGSLRISLRDWTRFLQHHLAGETGGSGYLSAGSYRELHRPRGDNYALGWAVAERSWGNGTVLQHDGTNGSNYCVVWLAPRRGFGVVICANQGDSSAALDEVASQLISVAVGSSAEDP